MQYKIPQNVDVEDKIFGPFSLRQFTWMVVGGFLTFVLYLLLAGTSFFLFFIAALPVVLVFGALAFLKINERPFELFIVSAYRGLLRPRHRVWLRIPIPEAAVVTEKPLSPALAPKPGLHEVRSRLEELTMIVDTRGWGRQTPAAQEFLADNRIVSAPTEAETPPEPEPDDPVEAPQADLDKALEEAGRAALARLKGRAQRARTIQPDDPSRRAYEEEVGKQEVTPPVGRYASPEEMRAALQSFQAGGTS
jgi:hypothetical protein